MKSHQIVAALCLLSCTNAVDMSQYSPGPGVEAAFEPWLKELYVHVEGHSACFSFIDFFQPPEQMSIAHFHASGPQEIIALKEAIIPPGGGKHENHVPNITTVHSESKSSKIYEVQGVLEMTFEGGNCSKVFYKALFSVVKDESGTVHLSPHDRTLIKYDDYWVEPLEVPTNIPCDV